MKKAVLFVFTLLVAGQVFGQLNPVKWSYEARPAGDGVYDLVFTAHIEDGWYVYSQFLESDEGPIATSFAFETDDKVELIDETEEAGEKHAGYDELFDMNVTKYSGSPTFTQRVKLKKAATLTGYLEYMTCDNQRCLPPKEVPFTFTLK